MEDFKKSCLVRRAVEVYRKKKVRDSKRRSKFFQITI